MSLDVSVVFGAKWLEDRVRSNTQQAPCSLMIVSMMIAGEHDEN